MQFESVSEFKHAPPEVIIVYPIVDLATDLSTGASLLARKTVIKPDSITLIAAIVRLMAVHRPQAPEPNRRVTAGPSAPRP
jgi:hypothetical protein